jgi:hypothetical protein
VVAGVGWPTAANVPRQTTFRREETCGIAAAAAIAGIFRVKRSEKKLERRQRFKEKYSDS